MALNKFADLTSEEFVASYMGYNANSTNSAKNVVSLLDKDAEIPDGTVDWTDMGAVSDVKNQG